MARHITTRAQVSGYRFGLARAEHALIRRDVRMLHDPMRSQSRALIAGVVIAVLIVAGAGVYGLVRPAPSVGDAQIVTDPGGAMFVLVDGVMHPVLNLASARLVVGSPAPVKSVSAASLREHPRGPTLGIAGAPASLPGPAADGDSAWTMCDGPDGTTVLSGIDPHAAAADTGVLVSYGDERWLLFTDRHGEGPVPVKARIDTTRVEVMRALGLEGVEPRPVSAVLLDAFPERPALAVPDVPGRGAAGPLGARVGTVVRTATVDGAYAYRVVLSDGVQQVPETAADMLLAVDADVAPTVRDIAPAELTRIPVVDRLPVGHFPDTAPTIRGGTDVVCRHWTRGRDDAAADERLVVAARLPVPDGRTPVRLGSADGVAGPGLDAVYLAPGTAEYVTLTGMRADSPLAGQRILVSDTGVRHRLSGDDAATSLGLSDAPVRAPWSVVSVIPAGPELSRVAALTMRDVVR
ncbi:type VII secretion protein EccB [Gordonia sp. HY002]|uniref:type VII secretion protein EccB n=1 Tax=Gordonia zhenghanii TaxID=2911516 RepID=UPI001EF13D80|nr:type VII secretion protein EccB [Gordonia zhenghanii]MCF8571435.1 type VII secretion protein EccB [Gordonia zhenghanii]MCF8607706.1 type VII secretion protein EccB [Gordonia zhenghanii]